METGRFGCAANPRFIEQHFTPTRSRYQRLRSRFLCYPATLLLHFCGKIVTVDAMRTVLLFGFLCLLTGCASFGERTLKIRHEFANGNLEKANAEIDKALKNRKQSDADLLKLNRAIIALSKGKPKEAETLLREVRDKFDQYERDREKRAAEKALSMLLDDNTVAYSGEDYENVLIRVFLALSNLMYDGTDAPAYALQIGYKQNEIIHKGNVQDPKDSQRKINPKSETYRQVAIGPYLIGAMQEAAYRNHDDVIKAYEAVNAWEPEFAQGRQDLERARRGVHAQPGNGVVYVFALVGEGPFKVQQNCEVLQDSQILATALIAMMSSRPVLPDFAPVMIPYIVRPRETVSAISVSVDGKWNGQTETLTDIGRMAEEQFEAVKPQIVARAVVRRTLKKGILYGTKEAVDASPWVGLLMDVGGMIWESIETADTRSWNLLPAEIQVTRLEVPAGEHRLTLQPMSRVFSMAHRGYIVSGASVRVGSEHSRTIVVEPGRNTYVLVNFPGNELVGDIVVSNEPER